MDERDSRRSILTADRRLCPGYSLLRQENRGVIGKLVEAAVRHDVAGLDAHDRRVAAVGHASLHVLLHNVVQRALCPASAFSSAPARRLSGSAPFNLLRRN